jgi:hypothetical protein
MLKMHHPKLCNSVMMATPPSPIISSSKPVQPNQRQYNSKGLMNNNNNNSATSLNYSMSAVSGGGRPSLRGTPLRTVGTQINVLANSTNTINRQVIPSPTIFQQHQQKRNSYHATNNNMQTQTTSSNSNFAATVVDNMQSNRNATSSSKLAKSAHLNETEFNELLRSLQEEYTNLVL